MSCKVTGCEQKVRAGGMCKRHYHTVYMKAYRLAHPDKMREYNKRSWGSLKYRAYQKKWRADNREKMTEYNRKWQQANPGRHYNLASEAWWDMFNQQEGKCVCGKEFGSSHKDWACVDHDHACCPSGKSCCGKCIRGLLCNVCNRILGIAHDDPKYLPDFLIRYLEEASV